MANQPLEIERKFLVKSLPENLDQYPHKDLLQGYIVLNTEKDETTVRLRRKGDKFFLAVKNGAGKVRVEREVEISETQFTSLWDATQGKRLEKTRYEIPYKGKIIELDVYSGKLKSFLIAEVEFSNEKECDSFIPPEWFGKEVTENRRYGNGHLAVNGVPKLV